MEKNLQSNEIKQCEQLWDICKTNYELELEDVKLLLIKYQNLLSEINKNIELFEGKRKDSVVLKQKELMIKIIALQASLCMLTNDEYKTLSVKEAYLKMYKSMLSSKGLLLSVGYLDSEKTNGEKINKIYPNGDHFERKDLDEEKLIIFKERFDFGYNKNPILKESENFIVKTNYEKTGFDIFTKINGEFIRIGQIFFPITEKSIKENGDVSGIITDKKFEKYGYELISLILEILNEYGIYNIRLLCQEPNSFKYRSNEGWELMKENFIANFQGEVSLVDSESKIYQVSTIKSNQKQL